MQRGWVHKDFRQGMPGWVLIINCSPNLSMELLQLLTHHRNWRCIQIYLVQALTLPLCQ